MDMDMGMSYVEYLYKREILIYWIIAKTGSGGGE